MIIINKWKLLCWVAVASAAFVALQSCIQVQVAIPNRWNRRFAEKQDYIECLTADQLKEMILTDTTHFKIVMLYSTGCGPCGEHLRRTYAPAYAQHRDDVKFYFISESTGGIKYCRDELERLGVYDGKVLCFLDDSPQFDNQKQGKNANLQVFNNLANHIFTKGPKVTGNFGIPCEFIVSKDNRVLKCLVATPHSGSAIKTAQLWQVDFDRIQEIDFDSIYRLEVEDDYFEGLPVCNGDFCPINKH